jgi:hypothetical protein
MGSVVNRCVLRGVWTEWEQRKGASSLVAVVTGFVFGEVWSEKEKLCVCCDESEETMYSQWYCPSSEWIW